MTLMIAEALVPVFFVMFLGYLAGARGIIDNRHVASLNVLVMTFALPAALFCGCSALMGATAAGLACFVTGLGSLRTALAA